jgi:response regulator RpfG family c-di-GMP phosphodiesterase
MAEIYIICVEDEPQVLDVIVRDLGEIEDVFPIEVANSADEARQLMREINEEGNTVGLILCDHIMPGDKGIDLLIEMQKDPWTEHTRKILITGQAGLEDTIQAVNLARLNRYIAKPWNPQQLREVVREELTLYVIAHEKDLLRFMPVLDQAKLQEAIRNRGYL